MDNIPSDPRIPVSPTLTPSPTADSSSVATVTPTAPPITIDTITSNDDSDNRPIILFENIVDCDPNDVHEGWDRCLQARLPDFRVESWDKRVDPHLDMFVGRDRIQFAVTWWADLSVLSRLPALRGVLLRGSGSDQVEPVTNLRSEVPLIRLIDPHSSEHLARYILHWVLHAQLRLHKYAQLNAKGVWQPLPYAAIGDKHESDRFIVGVMGFGLLGQTTVRLLYETLGFHVRVWRRTKTNTSANKKYGQPKKEGSLQFYTDLFDFVSGANVLVNFVPLNEGTRGVINKDVFRRLAHDATLISVGRGATIDIDDTLSALNEKRLALAVMDTFVEEPLNRESPLWKHPNVVITPHIAGRSYSYTGAQAMADNIQRILNDEQPFPIVPH